MAAKVRSYLPKGAVLSPKGNLQTMRQKEAKLVFTRPIKLRGK